MSYNNNYRKYNSFNKQFNKLTKGGEETSGDPAFAHIQPIQAQPLEVKVYDNFDRAFKAFRALVQKERILSTYKEKSSYEKPSDKHRRKKNESKRKLFELENKPFDKEYKRFKSKIIELDDNQE